MFIEYNGTKWVMTTEEGISVHATATGQYPPKTGWPDIGGVAVSLDYDMFGIGDDGTRTELTKALYDAFTNGTDNTLLQYEQGGSAGYGHVKLVLRYKQGTTAGWTEAEYAKALALANDALGCGAGMKTILVDDSGDTLFADDGVTPLWGEPV